MELRKAYSYIRMSTDIQLKGNSLKRQLELSDKYAKDNQLELVEGFEDIGVSAFKGKNTQKGALSVFLNALENGKIAPNAVLLVESLDRLSRDKLTQALNQFMRILESGVEIITLSDNQKYTQEIINKNPAALFISLSIMFRANEESEMKSHRLSSAWKNKRENASLKAVTKTCPGWLKLSDKTGKFEVIEKRGEVIKKIFELCIDTCGLASIAKYLNENKTPVFGNGRIWYTSYIAKIITNRSVMGEFQPHQIVSGKRQKSGEPISGYFPSIIDEQTFVLAQVAIARRSSVAKGRKGTNFTSLFTGITYCGHCGYRMRIRYRGGKSRSSRYLVCTNKIENGGCQMYEWNLADFETIMLNHLREINFEELLQKKSDVRELSFDDMIQVLTSKLKSNEEEIVKAIDLSISPNFSKEIQQRFLDKISQLDSESTKIKFEIDSLIKQSEQKEETERVFSTSALKQLLAEIKAKPDDYMFRSTLNQYLLKMIERISLAEPPDTSSPSDYDEDDPEVKAFRKTFKTRQKWTLDEILENAEFLQFKRQFHRMMLVQYRSGAERVVSWGNDASFNFDSKTKSLIEIV